VHVIDGQWIVCQSGFDRERESSRGDDKEEGDGRDGRKRSERNHGGKEVRPVTGGVGHGDE